MKARTAFSTLGTMFFLVFGSMFIFDVGAYIFGVEKINMLEFEFVGYGLFVFAGFLVAMSPDLLFFSIICFILSSFYILVMYKNDSFFAGITLWSIEMLIICFMSFISYEIHDIKLKHSYLAEKFIHIPDGYKEIHKSAKIAWIDFLGGTTGEEEHKKIKELLQKNEALMKKNNALLSLCMQKDKKYEELEDEYHNYMVKSYRWK